MLKTDCANKSIQQTLHIWLTVHYCGGSQGFNISLFPSLSLFFFLMVDHHPHLLGIPKGAPISDRKRKNSNSFGSYLSSIAGWCQPHKSSPKSIDKAHFEAECIEDIDVVSQVVINSILWNS